MSQKERTGLTRATLPLSVAGAIALLFALGQFHTARAQWATSGTNISNTNTGNVGVGTAAPSAKLDVTFDGRETTGVKIFDTRSAGTGFGGHLLFHGYSNGAGAETRFGQIGGLKENATAGSMFGFLGFYTNNGSGSLSMVERMRISSDGNVGIGTTTPGNYKLNVFGPIQGMANYTSYTPDGLYSVTARPSRIMTNSGGSILFGYEDWGYGDYSPRVGFQQTYDPVGSPYVTTTKASIGLVRNGSITIKGGAGNSEYMRLDASGNVGVGTAAPAYRLDVRDGQINASGGLCIAGDCKTAWSQVAGGTQWTTAGSSLHYGAGNVGIGTTTPTAKLDVNGDINVSGNINAKYQDIAEWVPTSQKLSPGTVVSLDPSRSNHVLASSSAYDTSVAGVVSAQPGLLLGEGGDGKVKVATTGRVRMKVDASKGPIRIGDLLVTGDIPGVAMKSVPVELGGTVIHRPGTIIGKALEPLDKGVGEILVLLSMQ